MPRRPGRPGARRTAEGARDVNPAGAIEMSAPQTTQAAERAERPGGRQVLAPLLDRLGGAPIIGPLAGLVVLIIAFAILSPVFFTTGNFSQIFQQVMEVGTLAVGQTLIIIAAGIDLSNGAIMVFGSIVMAKLAVSGKIGR